MLPCGLYNVQHNVTGLTKHDDTLLPMRETYPSLQAVRVMRRNTQAAWWQPGPALVRRRIDSKAEAKATKEAEKKNKGKVEGDSEETGQSHEDEAEIDGNRTNSEAFLTELVLVVGDDNEEILLRANGSGSQATESAALWCQTLETFASTASGGTGGTESKDEDRDEDNTENDGAEPAPESAPETGSGEAADAGDGGEERQLIVGHAPFHLL